MIISEATKQWWGRHQVPLKRTSYWQLGPLHLWVQKLVHQWRFNWEHSSDWLDPNVRVLPKLENEEPPAGVKEARFTFQDSSDELSFSPCLADRSVVTWLETPIHVLPGESLMLYVSTPLWIRVSMTDPAHVLQDIPTFRLSDTWFGPVNSLTGEMAYASRTPGVMQLQDIPFRPHCAITAVNLKNSGKTALPLDRLNLPMPRLSLFFSSRSGFWTEMVTLDRHEEDEFAALKLEKEAPSEASPTQFVASPRIEPEGPSHMIRAFSAFFRSRGEE